MSREPDIKKNAELLRKLQNKLRLQRQDLQRTHEYELNEKLKLQSIEHENQIRECKEKLTHQSTAHETEIKTLTEKFESELQQNIQKHKDDLQALREELHSAHEKELAAKDAVKAQELKDTENRFQSQHNKLQTKYNDLQTDYNTLQTTNNQLSRKTDVLKARQTQLQSQIDQLQQQNDTLISTTQREANHIAQDIDQWISSQSSSLSAMYANQPTFHELEAKISVLHNNAKQFIQTRLQTWSETNEELDAVMVESEEQQKIIQDLNAKIQDIEHRLQDTTQRLERVRNTYQDDLARDVNEYRIKMQQLQKQMESEIENRRKVEAEVVQLTEANNDFLQHIKAVEKQNNTYEVKTSHNEQVLSETKRKLEKTEQEIQQHQKHILQLQMELQNSILERKDISKQLARKNEELVDSKTALVSTRASNAKQVNALETALQNALSDLRDKTRDCQRLKERMESISDRLKTNAVRKQ